LFDVRDDNHAIVVRVEVLGNIIDVLLEYAVHGENRILEGTNVDLLQVRLLKILVLLVEHILDCAASVVQTFVDLLKRPGGVRFLEVALELHHDQLLELVELDLAAAILIFEELGECCLLVLRQTVAQVVTDGLGELPGVK
jgi:hypothetical protein